MPTPIQLTEAQRGSWATYPSDMSAFLINIAAFIIEIIAPKALKQGNVKETRLLEQVSSKILQHISSQNFKIMAVSGAYFRHLKGVIVWTAEDEKTLNGLLGPHLHDVSGSQYLESFYTNGRNASEAHCAFLRTILFPDLEESIRDKQHEKYENPFDDLLTSTIKIIDFLTTPYAVLYEEAETHKKSTSGIDLQWNTMQKALKSSVEKILAIKDETKLTPFNTPIGSKLKEQAAQINKDLQIFQACFGMANIRLEEQARYEKLNKEYQELLKKQESLDSLTRKMLPNANIATIEGRITAYGKEWNQRYEKLKQQNFKAALDSALAEQNQLRQQLKEKQEQIEQLTGQLALAKQQEQSIAQLRAEQDKLVTQNKQLVAQATEWDNAQLLMTAGNNPQKVSFIQWIKHLLSQVTHLTQSNQQLSKTIDTLKQPPSKSAANNHPQQAPSFQLELPPLSLPLPPVVNADHSVPVLETWGELFQTHCSGTNSTGVKEIMAEIKTLQNAEFNETEKLTLLGMKMRAIAHARKDSNWSKSHFFGKGRHQGVQALYDFMVENGFSLHNKNCCEQFQALLSGNDFVHLPPHGENEATHLLSALQ